MHSLLYDPEENEYTILNENKYGDKCFVRKILRIKNLHEWEQNAVNIEIKILESIKNTTDNALIKIYELKKPTDEKDGYVDMELYSTFLDYSIREDEYIDLNDIVYNKHIIGDSFNGTNDKVLDVYEKLHAGTLNIEELPNITVLKRDNKELGTNYITLNNKLLWLHKNMRQENNFPDKVKVYTRNLRKGENEIYKNLDINSVTISEKEDDVMIIERNEDLYDINKEIEEHIHRIEDDIKKCLIGLHKIGIVYINLNTANIVYSYEDSCWKLINFTCCGILNQRELLNTNDWKVAPDITSNMYSHVHEEDINKLMYDTKAFEIFALQLKQFIETEKS